ncbi:MAG: tetratricopeptide repeat protein [Ferruginibacter sp.]
MAKPYILALAGLIVVFILYFGFNITPKKKIVMDVSKTSVGSFNIQHYIDSLENALPVANKTQVSNLEGEIEQSQGNAAVINSNEALAYYWKDSLKAYEPYAFYISQAAKLDNSEKKLTFAAQIFLNNLRWENDPVKLGWETSEAIELFEKALALNPDNTDLKIGLGSSYIFGRGRNGNPEETMKGVQSLLSVVRQDSTNMKAQFMLGMGGYISGQYDKAIERLLKVVNAQPENAEALAFLADTYAAKGDKASAIKWYNVSKRIVNDAHYSAEVNQRIKELR